MQLAYNAEHGITPESIVKSIRRGIEEEIQAKVETRNAVGRDETTDATEEYLNELEAEMLAAAENLEFERAAALRDRILQLRSSQGGGPARPIASAQATSAKAKAKSKARSGGGRKPKAN